MSETTKAVQKEWDSLFVQPRNNITRGQLFDLANNIPNLLSQVKELEALLDNYRGTCDECGRTNVLLDFVPDYDGVSRICLLDTEGCKAEHEARVERARDAYLKRREETPDDPMWTMKDYYNKSLLESLQGLSLGRNPLEPRGQVYEWRRATVLPAEYGSFYKGADDDTEAR